MGPLLRTIIRHTGITVIICLWAALLLLPSEPAYAATTTLAPSAAGDRTALRPIPAGAGTNYLRVQTNDGDTSYVTSGTSASYLTDLCNLPDVALSGTINSVTVTIVAKANTTPSQASAYTVIKTNGIEYNGTAQTLTTAYAPYSTAYATNPNTGSAWTWTQINNLQAGVALRRANTSFF